MAVTTPHRKKKEEVGERPACPRTAKRPARLGYPRPCRAEEEGTSGEVTGAVRGASQATVRGRGRRLRRGPRPSARQDLTAHLVPARAPPPSPHATPPPARRQTRCHLPPTGRSPTSAGAPACLQRPNQTKSREKALETRVSVAE